MNCSKCGKDIVMIVNLETYIDEDTLGEFVGWKIYHHKTESCMILPKTKEAEKMNLIDENSTVIVNNKIEKESKKEALP